MPCSVSSVSSRALHGRVRFIRCKVYSIYKTGNIQSGAAGHDWNASACRDLRDTLACVPDIVRNRELVLPAEEIPPDGAAHLSSPPASPVQFPHEALYRSASNRPKRPRRPAAFASATESAVFPAAVGPQITMISALSAKLLFQLLLVIFSTMGRPWGQNGGTLPSRHPPAKRSSCAACVLSPP